MEPSPWTKEYGQLLDTESNTQLKGKWGLNPTVSVNWILPTTQIIKEIDSYLEPLESNSIFPTYVF